MGHMLEALSQAKPSQANPSQPKPSQDSYPEAERGARRDSKAVEPEEPTKALEPEEPTKAVEPEKPTKAVEPEKPTPPTKATAAKSAAAPPKHPKSHEFDTTSDDDLYVDVHDEEALVMKKREELAAQIAQCKIMS